MLALILTIAWIGLVSGIPTYRRMRRTGDVDVLARSRRGSPQWWARLISVLGVALAFATPIAELAGLPAIAAFDHPVVRWLGVALIVAGTALTLGAQATMGDSWRGDVDPDVTTPLVTGGPFRYVRNPIFSGTATVVLGLALMVPNVLALAMVLVVLTGLEIQVRLVEEPYLIRVHGDAYRRYAARTGRFLPGIGRLKSSTDGVDRGDTRGS